MKQDGDIYIKVGCDSIAAPKVLNLFTKQLAI